MVAIRQMARLALMSFVMLAALSVQLAQAQQAVDANCNFVADKEIGDDQKICNTWEPCAVLSRVTQSCARAKQFLTRIGDAISGKAKEIEPRYDSLPDDQKMGVWQKIKAKFTADDVAVAARPALTNAKPLNDNIAEIDDTLAKYRAAKARGAAITPGSTAYAGAISSTKAYYEGEYKDGAPNGVGTIIYPDGETQRGQFKDGALTGKGEATYADGWVMAGKYGKGKFIAGADQNPAGRIRGGAFNADGTPLGKSEITFPDGTSQIQYVNKDKQVVAKGPVAAAGQEAEEPPLPAGYPADPKIPAWSPSSPTGQMIEYTMLWGRQDPGSALALAQSDPATRTHMSDFAFCRPIVGSLTAAEKAECGIKDEPPPRPQPEQTAQGNDGAEPLFMPGLFGPASPVGSGGTFGRGTELLSQEEITRRRQPPAGNAPRPQQQAMNAPPPRPAPAPPQTGGPPSEAQMLAEFTQVCASQLARFHGQPAGSWNEPNDSLFARTRTINGGSRAATAAEMQRRIAGYDNGGPEEQAFACGTKVRLRYMGAAPQNPEAQMLADFRQTCAPQINAWIGAVTQSGYSKGKSRDQLLLDADGSFHENGIHSNRHDAYTRSELNYSIAQLSQPQNAGAGTYLMICAKQVHLKYASN